MQLAMACILGINNTDSESLVFRHHQLDMQEQRVTPHNNQKSLTYRHTK